VGKFAEMEDAMKRAALGHIAPVAAALVFAAFAASAAQSAENEHPRDRTQTGAAAQAKALGGVVAPGARLAALVDAGGAPVRTKGVQSIERIDVGVYCIRPRADSNINVNNSIVIVSPEFFYSDVDEVIVQWAASGSGCGAGRFGVYTLSDGNHDGAYSFTNAVGFSVYVP
jgi:hypothetical protein